MKKVLAVLLAVLCVFSSVGIFTAKASVSSVKDSTDGISLQNFTAAGSNSSNIVIGMGDEPDYILSCLTSMMSSMVITTTIEEGLINEKIDGSLYPGLALNVPSLQDGTWTTYDVNGKTYMKTTYYLREDAKWSDGVPINYKDDINFAVYDIYLSGKIKQIPSTEPYNKIEKIEFPNPYTMVVTWNSAISSANRGLPIYPKHFYSQVPLDQLTSSTLVKKPVHAGPYRVKEWVEGSYITVEPNPYYYGEMPKNAGLTFKFSSNTITNLQSGNVDMALDLSYNDAKQAKEIPGLTVLTIPSTSWEHLEINCTDPILSDVRVRQAIAYGIDYDDLNNKVFYGQRIVSYYPYLSLFNEYYRNPNAVLPKYNEAKANQLLDEAGWTMGPDGYRYKDGKKLTLELATTTRQDRKDLAVVLQDQLKKIGIDIQPKYLNSIYFFGTYCTHRMFQLALFAWNADPLDPGGFTLYHSSQIPTEENGWSGQNYTGINDKQLDDAIYKATHLSSAVERKNNYYIAEQRIVDLIPQIGLNIWTDMYAFKDNIRGINYKMSSSIPITWNAKQWFIGYVVSASAGEGGSITPSGEVSASEGDSKTFTITPNVGYRIKDVLVDGKSVGAVSTYAFTNITSDHTISATFEKQITETVIVLTVGSSTFTVNGSSRTLDSPPVIKNSRTLLPIRAVIEALGGTVDWIPSTKEVKIILANNTVELWIGNPQAKVNGITKWIDDTNHKVVPEIINGRTMIPLRFVTENLGATVDWNQDTKTITITYRG